MDNELKQKLDKVSELMVIKNFIPPEEIRTEDDYKKASDSVKFINDKVKLAETYRKQLVEPFVVGQKEINSKFKEFTEPLDKIMKNIKEMMLGYMKYQQEYQKLLEDTSKKESDADIIVVDDTVDAIKHSEFSSNTLKTVTKYRVKDELLRSSIEVKPVAFKEYLKEHKIPDFIESYEEESIVVRTV